ncbi:MAG: hypothetical protein J5750_04825 [Clostridiales bacterium]|nr:hypothetical protein [Clostridiales bacterium]
MGLFDFLGKGKEKAEAQAAAAAQLAQSAPVGASGIRFGSQYGISTTFVIAPKPLDVGVKRSKELQNKIVVTGTVKGGEFSKGDAVALVGPDGVVKALTKLLDVIKDDGANDFNTLLSANMGKKEAGLGVDAYLILDMSDGVNSGDIVAKL